MIIYNVNLFIVYTLLFISRINKDSGGYKLNSKVLNSIAFVCMWIISGFRYLVGTDFDMYQNYYINIDQINMNNNYLEVGYLILNKVVKIISRDIFNEQIIFVVTSFIILLSIYKVVIQYSNKYEMSIFLFITMYFYYSSFNGLRQFIAIGITFLGLKYIEQRNFRAYMTYIFIACLFHSSAIVMLIAYFIVNNNFRNNTYFIILSISIIIYSFLPTILNIIFKIIPRYSKYSGNGLNIFLNEGSHWMHSVILLIIFLISILFKDKLVNLDKKNNIYINFIFFATIFQIFGMKSVLFSRVVYYFSIYSIILIPSIVSITIKKLKPIVYMFILLVFYSINFVLLLLNQSNVIPYIFKMP